MDPKFLGSNCGCIPFGGKLVFLAVGGKLLIP
jgi:hypothetical protein